MPWKSQKQEAWGNSPTGKQAMGEDAVDEFNQASKGKKLPMKKKPSDDPMPRGNGRPLINMKEMLGNGDST